MSIRRRVLPGMVALALGLSVTSGMPGRTAAACALTWTSLTTSSKTVTVGLATYTGTVRYKLEMNTCNLGVYTRIYVDSFTDKAVIQPNLMYPNYVYVSDNAILYKNCNGFTEGCLLYPGVAAYVDGRAVLGTLDSHGVSTVTRTAYPRVTYTYSTYTATTTVYRFVEGGPIWKFVYQFRRGVIYS